MTTSTSAPYTKPLPRPRDAYSKKYWDSIHAGKIILQKCSACGYIRHPHARMCPECLEVSDDWVELSGRGVVWSFGVYYHVFNQAFKDDIPYNIALIELDEGPFLMSNMVGITNDDIKVGMPVEAVFDRVTEDFTLLRFQPRGP